MLVRRELKIGSDGKLYSLLDVLKLAVGDIVMRSSFVSDHWGSSMSEAVIKVEASRIILQSSNYADNGTQFPVVSPNVGIQIEQHICPSIRVTEIMSDAEIKKEVEKRRLQVQRGLLRWPYEHDFIHFKHSGHVMFFFMKQDNK